MQAEKVGLSAHQIVLDFRSFLSASWVVVMKYTEARNDESLILDWMQANWEILVETTLCTQPNEYLEVYGDGADCNGDSSRVWMPKALPTHRIVCLPSQEFEVVDEISKSQLDPGNKTFNRFVSWNQFQYQDCPPFDFALLEDVNNIYIVPVSSITFHLKAVDD